MRINSIHLRGAKSQVYYTSYYRFMTDLLEAYATFPVAQFPLHFGAGIVPKNLDKAINIVTLAMRHFSQVSESEEQIAATYGLPPKSLLGAQLIYGGSRRLREALKNPSLRQKIVTDQISYQVIIWVDNRDITVYCHEEEGPDLIREEPLAHDFFKYMLDIGDRYDLTRYPIIVPA